MEMVEDHDKVHDGIGIGVRQKRDFLGKEFSQSYEDEPDERDSWR